MSRRRRDPLWLQAQALAASSQQRPRQQIRQAQAEARRQAQEDAQMIEGFTRALANMLGGAGAAVDKTYGEAADRQQRIGQGYALGQQHAEQASADQANALLARQGGARRIQAGPGSQVTYALGGAAPASLLNETGAAMSALAHQLPSVASGRGQVQAAQRLRQGQLEQEKLRGQLEDLAARLPGLTAEQYDHLVGRALQERSIGIQADYLGIAGRKAGADITGVDPYTGEPTLDASVAAANAAGKSGKNRQKQAVAARKARTGALSAAHENSYQLATQLYKGVQVKTVGANGLPVTTVQRPTRQQAYQKLYARYGKPLERYAPKNARGWWLRQIKAMLNGALTYAGYGPRPTPPPWSKVRPG